MRLAKNFIKQTLTVLVGADLIFGTLIRIWKDLGHMCFWSHGQSFSGKVYYTRVVAHHPLARSGPPIYSKQKGTDQPICYE